MSAIPKLRAIYFKQLVDRAFQRFVREMEPYFTRMGSPESVSYVYSGTISRNTLKRMFLGWILEDLGGIFGKFDLESPEYVFVLGSCLPRNNALLRCAAGETKFPAVLRKILASGRDIRYYPAEKDIRIDLDLFNSVFEDVFLELFDRKRAKIHLGPLFRNVFFLRHSVLDCYMAFKLLRMQYGRNTVENVVKNLGMKTDVGLRSINERIDEHVSGKISFLKSKMMEPVREEVAEFVRGCLDGRLS